jgi:hypothetical protein
MTFVKRQLAPFSSTAADPLFNFTQPFIQQGVISGRYYSADEVAYGNPKPGYLQATENSDVVTVVASSAVPLRLVFALGLHDANTGGEIGSWRTFTGKSSSNTNLTITANQKAWVYAEINENGQPNNPTAWTIQYASEPANNRTYSSQETEPNAPVDGNVWFNPITNLLKKYDADTSQWITRKRVYLGEIGIGTNGYVYSVQSWFPELGYAQYQDSFYPPWFENPWRHYDGVSFTTNGQYTAMEAANWANNATIGQAVAGNRNAMSAVVNSSAAMASVANASNTMVYIANSTVALEEIANSVIAQSAIVSGTQNTVFLATIANNASSLTALAGGSVGNIISVLIGTNSTYQVLSSNSLGQLAILSDLSIGPILATGGNTVTQISDGGTCYRVHTFTGTGAFNLCSKGTTGNVEYLVVAGGGSGGMAPGAATYSTGGAGAGGYRTGTGLNLPTVCSYAVVIGAGGTNNANGNPSSFSTITSCGGGRGGSNGLGCPGGSGGGHGIEPRTTPGPGAAAATGIAGQGCPGGTMTLACGNSGSGGGGAGEAGFGCRMRNDPGVPQDSGGSGGNGLSSSITGTPIAYAGGGGGIGAPTTCGGAGGSGGGGRGSVGGGADCAENGVANRGGGGGGANGPSPASARAGGSGIVVVRYPI